MSNVDICPGCFYLNKITPLVFYKTFACQICKDSISSSSGALSFMHKTFSVHSRTGYACQKCTRFVPDNIESTLICPYPNCSAIFDKTNLKKKQHPKHSAVNSEIQSIQSPIQNILDKIQEDVIYGSHSSTIPLKTAAIEAFQYISITQPKQFLEYLTESTRYGFQHKLFQAFTDALEKKLPYVIFKKKKPIHIDNLLHEQLSIFSKISSFDGVVNDDLIVTNNTSDYYTSNKSSKTTQLFIGKLLSIDDTAGNSLINNVVDYSFHMIKLKNVQPLTNVVVSHLAIPPHYQMGGMVYLNRLRQEIAEILKKQ